MTIGTILDRKRLNKEHTDPDRTKAGLKLDQSRLYGLIRAPIGQYGTKEHHKGQRGIILS